MNPSTVDAIRAHAESVFPKECCGLVYVQRGKERYQPCENLATDSTEHFILSPVDYAATEDKGEITCLVHSHCYEPPFPSEADKVSCENTGLPWFIYSLPTHQTYEFKPTGYKAPLIGREFFHGVLDCYTLVRDHYKTIGIELPDYPRENEWWLHGESLYLDNFKAAGFVEVDDLKPNDGLLMQIASQTPNHAAVYVGDNRIIQHLSCRLSSLDVYGGWFEKVTVKILRHQSLC
jgi:proteasome lid subunit RPN8/RPN11